MIEGFHHVAIICTNYAVSKRFYTELLGFEIVEENYRDDKKSYKLDLRLPNGNQIELFSFPDPAKRPNYPEASGLRHLAFKVSSVESVKAHLEQNGLTVEPVRIDEYTGRRYTFFQDPDGLPLELYENE